MLAFDRAGDPDWYPELGEPFQPLKMYYTTWSMARLSAVHARLIERDGTSPFDEKWFDRPDSDHRITTRVEVGDFQFARSASLRAHATQVDPTESFWFGLTDDELADVYPYDDSILARSLVGPIPADTVENDLFAGIRSSVTSRIVTTIQYRVVVGKKDERVDGPDDADVVVTVPLDRSAATTSIPPSPTCGAS